MSPAAAELASLGATVQFGAVATVDAFGLMTAMGTGRATITAAAVYELAREGALDLDAFVFDLGQAGGGLLDLDPFPSLGDARLAEITVRQLLRHRGGWDRSVAGDLTYREIEIAEAMSVPSPPGRHNTVRYILGQPLQFDPGSERSYSNIGYLILGLIIEEVSGADYLSVLFDRVLSPLGVTYVFSMSLPGFAVHAQAAPLVQKRGALVSVGRVTVGPGGGDVFSRPDYRVEIRRMDRAVEQRVVDLSDRIGERKADSAGVVRLMSPLQEKQRLSEVRPGPPLTVEDEKRLAELSKLERATHDQLQELVALNAKKRNAALRPGPPLTPAEAARMRELEGTLNELRESLSSARSRRGELLDTIVGYTAVVGRDAKTVHFGSSPVLTVYPGDLLVLTVVDVDVTEDDLYGVHAVQVTREMIAAGSAELGPTAGIRALELNFRSR